MLRETPVAPQPLDLPLLPLCALLAFLSPIPAVLAWDTLPLMLSLGEWVSDLGHCIDYLSI